MTDTESSAITVEQKPGEATELCNLTSEIGDDKDVNIALLQDGVEDREKTEEGKENEDSEGEKTDEVQEKIDPWAIVTKEDESPHWGDLSNKQKIRRVAVGILEILGVLVSLYLFICSLGFLGDAFKLVGGKAAGSTFRHNKIIQNPVAGLMIGLLATVLLQSSSTTTSIIITMAGEDIIPFESTIPMVMGANIGTSVTNTIVSLAQSVNREEFRRAFGGAVLLDMFNWMTVLVLLPLEAATSYLYHLTGAIVDSMHLGETGTKKQDLLKAITKPFTKLILEIDNSVITGVATRRHGTHEEPLLKRWCVNQDFFYNMSDVHHDQYEDNSNDSVALMLNLTQRKVNYTINKNGSKISVDYNETHTVKDYIHVIRCPSLFAQTDLGDNVIGILMLIISLILIVVTLICMVKLLNSALKGSLAQTIKRTINSNFPGKWAFLTGYLFILIGTGMTVIVQSSSVFTSMLTPLVGVGVVSLDRMYVLTLGANIGTTITGILAALSASSESIPIALRVAFAHLFFNITGVVMFYPIPLTRKIPIELSKILGNTTAKYRWFSLLYIVVMFFMLPGFVFGLSMAGNVALMAVGIPFLLFLAVIIVINIMQRKCSRRLPKVLRTWDFLPKWLHSLKPYDKFVTKIIKTCHCFKRRKSVS